ncbi:hypothetical protein [Streptomyces sp. C184]
MTPVFLKALTYPPPYNTMKVRELLFYAGIGLGLALLFAPPSP